MIQHQVRVFVRFTVVYLIKNSMADIKFKNLVTDLKKRKTKFVTCTQSNPCDCTTSHKDPVCDCECHQDHPEWPEDFICPECDNTGEVTNPSTGNPMECLCQYR